MQKYFVHDTSIIDEGAVIGEGTRIWHFSHVMPGAVIGNNCNLGQNIFIDNNVSLGNGVKVQNNVSIYNGVKIEDDVFIGPSVVFTNVINPRSFIERKNEFLATLIKKGATVGANATIICGNEIGDYSFVAAGSVVTKDVLPYSMVAGNPARHSGWVSEAGHPMEFNGEGLAQCSASGTSYRLLNNRVTKL